MPEAGDDAVGAAVSVALEVCRRHAYYYNYYFSLIASQR